MFGEDELLPVSALHHLAFCERRWGLIHLERIWEDNVLTVEGNQLHKRAHVAEAEVRAGVRISRALPLRSLRLGLYGVADVVEFHPVEEGGAGPDAGTRLEGVAGLWRPYPVEYKRGRPNPTRCDEVQVCAQALCLEEMLGIAVPEGAIFFGRPRRRMALEFDEDLRARTEALARRLHELSKAGRTPAPVYEKRCRNCSLLEVCMPRVIEKSKVVERYLARALDDSFREEGET